MTGVPHVFFSFESKRNIVCRVGGMIVLLSEYFLSSVQSSFVPLPSFVLLFMFAIYPCYAVNGPQVLAGFLFSSAASLQRSLVPLEGFCQNLLEFDSIHHIVDWAYGWYFFPLIPLILPWIFCCHSGPLPLHCLYSTLSYCSGELVVLYGMEGATKAKRDRSGSEFILVVSISAPIAYPHHCNQPPTGSLRPCLVRISARSPRFESGSRIGSFRLDLSTK